MCIEVSPDTVDVVGSASASTALPQHCRLSLLRGAAIQSCVLAAQCSSQVCEGPVVHVGAVIAVCKAWMLKADLLVVTRMLTTRGSALLSGGLAFAALSLRLLLALVRRPQGGREVPYHGIHPHQPCPPLVVCQSEAYLHHKVALPLHEYRLQLSHKAVHILITVRQDRQTV